MKRYIITGSTSGIGKHLFLDLSTNNYVIGIYRDDLKKNQLIFELNSKNYDFIKLDLSSPKNLEAISTQLKEPVDGVIYAAGVGLSWGSTIIQF
jgi:short-subunit dehydrogenase